MNAGSAPWTGGTWQLVIRALGTRKLDGEWKEPTAKLCELWRKQVLSGRMARGSYSYEVRRLGGETALDMLVIHIKLGDDINAKRIGSNSSLALQSAPRTYVRLLQRPAWKDWLADSLTKHWRRITPDWRGSGVVPLTSAMRKAADEVIAAIEDEKARYYAEVSYAAVRERRVNKEGKPTGPSRDQPRLATLAKAFSLEKVQDKTLQTKCLEVLSIAADRHDLKDVIYAVCARQKPLAVAVGDDDGQKERYKIYLKFLIEDGKLDSFAAVVKDLKRGLAFRDRSSEPMLASMAGLLGEYLSGEDNDAPEQWANTPAKYLAMRKAFKAPGADFCRRDSDMFGAMAVLHFVCGKQDELKTWLEPLPGEDDSESLFMDPSGRGLSLKVCLNVFARAAAGRDGPARKAVADGLARFVASPLIRARLAKGAHPFAAVLRHKALAADPLLRQAADQGVRKAIENLNEKLAAKGDDVAALRELIFYYNAVKDYPNAERMARKWAEATGAEEARLAVIRQLTPQGKHEQVISLCQKLIAEHPDQAAYADALKWAYAEAGRIDEALQQARLCVEKFPAKGKALMDLGDILLKARKLPESLAAYQEAKRVTDDHNYGHRIPVQIGMVRFEMNELDKAEKIARGGGGCDEIAIKLAAELLKKVQAARKKNRDNSGKEVDNRDRKP